MDFQNQWIFKILAALNFGCVVTALTYPCAYKLAADFARYKTSTFVTSFTSVTSFIIAV